MHKKPKRSNAQRHSKLLAPDVNFIEITSLPSLLPENGARGGGLEIRLYDTDPDEAVTHANTHDHQAVILKEAENKPHGLREAIILCENGYAWLPSRRLSDEEIAAFA